MSNQPPSDTSRRQFVAAGLASGIATGFAQAVTPVTSTLIHTDAVDLLVGTVNVPAGDELLPAYRAQPLNTQGPLPVVLVIQEIFGVHEHIQDLCRRLAKQGYLAIAPELYFRQGDARTYTDLGELVSKLVSRVPDQQVLADLDATAQWATAHGGDAQRMALTGFCWGGRMAWLYAEHNPTLKAAAVWYGRVMGATNPLQPQQPIDLAAQLRVPVIGFFGGKDQGISVDSVQKMQAALQASGHPAEIHIYPEAAHGFNADYRPSYNAAAATDAWGRMLAFFRQHGV